MAADSVRSYQESIYSSEWRAWRDPDVPEWIDPIGMLIGRHCGTPAETKPAIIADGVSTSYGELAASIRQCSAGLTAIGLRPESRILLFGTDSLDYVTTWLAAVNSGVIPVVVSDLYKPPDLLYFLTDTGVCALFIDCEQVPKLREIRGELPSSLRIVIVRGEGAAELARHLPDQTIVDLRNLAAAGQGASALHRFHANDVAYMFYSGGTTGTAKGVTHLAHDFVLVPERHGHFWEYSVADTVFATSKKYFTHGLWPGVLIPLYWGATAVLDRRPPTPDVVLAALRNHAVTKLVTVPTVLKNLIEHLMQATEPVDAPALRFVMSASEKMPPEMFERFYQLTGIELFDSIGSSEITYEWIANRQKAFKRGSLGKPVFGCRIRLMDVEGREVTEPNIPGEAWVNSRTSCFFYWRKYDKSRETFVGEWTRTGDQLYFDEDGFFWFAGRANDLFKVRGMWISPIDVESALTNHPAIREAAVVSFEDDDGLTKPRAYLVLRKGFQQYASLFDELRESVRPIGSYKIPASFVFIDELPRTTLQKIDRRALRGAASHAEAPLDQPAVPRERRQPG
jgi:benzoate-CoA ligase family protein